MEPFREELRYIYPLTKSSLVLDIGAHRGDFAAEISRLYDCEIWAFEPFAEFIHVLIERFGPLNPKVLIFPHGVGNITKTEKFIKKGCMSGEFADQGPTEQVAIIGIGTVMHAMKGREISLAKLNCEGGEFQILEEMIAQGYHLRCRDIQVQFHDCVRDAGKRHAAIREALLKTHELTYDAPFCWENYRLRDFPK